MNHDQFEDLIRGTRFAINIGYVAEDKEFNSKQVKVYPPEIMPYLSGNLNDMTSAEVATLMDERAELEISTKVKTTNVITANYFGADTNRSGPPDVRRGEKVFLIRIEDTDMYYWYPAGLDDNLRRLEHLRFAVSDDARMQKELGEDNTYYLEMDTLHNKHIVIRTAQSSGEAYRYMFKIDAKANKLFLQDNIGNELLMESDTPRMRMRNSANSFIDLFGEDIIIGAVRDVIFKAGRQTLYTSPAMSMTSPSGVIVLSCSGMTLNADNYSVNASTIGLNASSVKIPGQIVAGYVQAEGYSTGSAGSGYNKASVTLEDGEGSNPSVTPDMGSGGDGNRHCAAHEETKEALDIIADCLQKIDELLPYGGNYSAIPGLADNTIMNKNTGE